MKKEKHLQNLILPLDYIYLFFSVMVILNSVPFQKKKNKKNENRKSIKNVYNKFMFRMSSSWSYNSSMLLEILIIICLNKLFV